MKPSAKLQKRATEHSKVRVQNVNSWQKPGNGILSNVNM